MSTAVYIAPSEFDEDISGIRNIFMSANFADKNPHEAFRSNPRLWKHVGHTNSAGRIIALDHAAIGENLARQLAESQPLTPGSIFKDDVTDKLAELQITRAQEAASRNECVLIAAPQRNGWPAVYSVQPQHMPRADIQDSIEWPGKYGFIIAHFHHGKWFKPGGWVEITNQKVLDALNSVPEVKFDFTMRASVHDTEDSRSKASTNKAPAANASKPHEGSLIRRMRP